ncbi:hypothetical protein LCGC14_0351650 [marine sediment metagenome]|uniref:Uncharacterized protein n=1 Tax=marine sediment metagenome TaxID=412755 RepID=A0A0F9VY10_9ZZZZ
MKAKKVRLTTWDRPNHQVKDLVTGKVSKLTFGEFVQGLCDDLDKKQVKYVIEPDDKDRIALFAWNKEPADQVRIKSVKAIRDTCPNCGVAGEYEYVGVYSELKECKACKGYKWADEIERSIDKEE